ncbi:MAG: hypothetical protein V1837_01650 [Candidatus Woesearchaeota archaeon]
MGKHSLDEVVFGIACLPLHTAFFAGVERAAGRVSLIGYWVWGEFQLRRNEMLQTDKQFEKSKSYKIGQLSLYCGIAAAVAYVAKKGFQF